MSFPKIGALKATKRKMNFYQVLCTYSPILVKFGVRDMHVKMLNIFEFRENSLWKGSNFPGVHGNIVMGVP